MILVFAVNFLSAIWILSRICQLDTFSAPQRWVGFLTIPLTVVVARHSSVVGLLLLHAPALTIAMTYWYRQWRERESIATHQRELIENVILTMRSGKSFRTALNEAAMNLPDGSLARLLRPWVNSIRQRPPPMPPWWSEMATELLAIEQQSHQALSRLQNWRTRLKFAADFKRRVGQVKVQVRLQAVVVSGIYLALLAFTILRGSWNQNAMLIGTSLAMFFSGLGLILQLGRRIKWTF